MSETYYGQVIYDKEMSDAEGYIYKWQIGQLGSFFTTLIEAIARADYENRAKLRKVYPELVDAYKAFTQGNLASKFDRLEEKYAIKFSRIDKKDAIHDANR